MTLKLITAPAAEPLSLTDAKLHLRIDSADEDAIVAALISAARERVEHMTGRSFVAQTWERVLDEFPAAEIALGRPPVQSIMSITYIDPDGVTQVLPDPAYSLDSDTEPGFVLPAQGYTWPATLDTANAVRVRFVAGFDAVPASVVAWMKINIGTQYKYRETHAAGSHADLSPFVDRLLDRWVVYG